MPSHATLAKTRTANVASVNRLCRSLTTACAWLPVLNAASRLGLSRNRLADRKSTRLNSSHLVISYAVFCLKKKKITELEPRRPDHVLITVPTVHHPLF